MIRNFASAVAKEPVSESWVTRFINKYTINLISKYSTGMDSDCHKADSHSKYKLYFDLLQAKIDEYNVEVEDTYNMDKKGFLIGITTRTKHVFSRPCVCGDGSALPPGLLYESANNTIQTSWVEEIKAGEHNAFVSSSPTGWTNNDIGLAWLKQVFNRFTKAKARRKYRLLILDGHGSHVTIDFINYCDKNKILLAILPPYSTHTLQPLDVVMFKPLLTAYLKELTTYLHHGQGLAKVKKSNFFYLFWKAWPSPEASDSNSSSNSVYSGKDWLKIETLLRKVAKDEGSKELRKISRSLHHISIQNSLLHHEIAGLKEVLKTQKKHKNKSKTLDLQQKKWAQGGAVFWSPWKVEEARQREKTKQQEQRAEELRKAEMAELRKANKLYKEKIAEEKRVRRAREKEERKQAKAQKAAEEAERKAIKERDKKLQNAQKAIQLS
ncbi:hypothetical protein OPT61_g4512 [Boeremia exigua]|uniref:Uncharacterized protein n=1 Tax=Boeremia exigua TaxID=749465 RepID=A0ACC2IE07_9PLEO|nr:hypothetical protein OPT61_g4512 [Boeremia exigua]